MPEHQDKKNFDLIIIGGGLAGASLASALKGVCVDANKPLKIAVIEAFPLNADAQPSYDDRTVALSYGSRCIFENIAQNKTAQDNKTMADSLWSLLAPHAEAINTIHISDRGHFGVTRLTREQEGVEALGYVLENRAIGQQLYQVMAAGYEHGAISTTENITLFCPAVLSSLQQDENSVSVECSVNGEIQRLSAKLLVAADGNKSRVMEMLAIGSSRKDYHQVALITNVTPGKKHDNVAYERFTDSGPLAFLPMPKNRCSVVWTLGRQQADYLYGLNDEDFLQQLQQRFGYRLGQLKKVGVRQIYPLFLQSATQIVNGRVAIIGNAAHSVHPVAGQGFNLALRDVALLSELIVDSQRAAEDIGSAELLHQYAALREDDIQRVYRFTDALVKTFSNAIAPLAHMRSLSLLLVDVLPGIKHQLAAQSMGLSGRLPRLNRGLRL